MRAPARRTVCSTHCSSEASLVRSLCNGRLRIAQQFTAGITRMNACESVKRTAEISTINCQDISRPFHGLTRHARSDPTDESIQKAHETETNGYSDQDYGMLQENTGRPTRSKDCRVGEAK